MDSRIDFLNTKKQNLFQSFIQEYKTIHDVSEVEAANLLKSGDLFKRLTEEWYDKLESG